jgi:hypothetical protein
MEYTKEDIKGLVKRIIRKDLLIEALSIIEACTDKDLVSIKMNANRLLESNETSFGNILCMELDLLKSKLEYLGRIPKVKSEIGWDPEFIPELIGKWRDEKLGNLLP